MLRRARLWCSGDSLRSPEGVGTLFLTSAPYSYSSGGGGRQLCTAGTPRPETKHATNKTHIAWLPSACRRRGIQESHWATALPHNRPSRFCENYACCAIPLLCSTRCYTRGCCWASNALPRLLAICHSCSGGGLLVSRKPDSRPPLLLLRLTLSLWQRCVQGKEVVRRHPHA